MILLIDNYDSFTYNIYQMIANMGREVEVIRNDKITTVEIDSAKYEAIVISPGPGTPDDAGVCKDVVRVFAGKVPILGICLGHQVIGEVFGGKVIRAGKFVHGKTSPVKHIGTGAYQGLSQDILVGRYHSLIVERESLPDCLEITAELEDGMIMGIRHRDYKVEGIQFHPESILTPDGEKILGSFLGFI